MQKLKQKLKSFLASRKGLSLGQLPTLFFTVMVIGIFAGATYIVLENFQSTLNNTSKAYVGIGYVLDFVDAIVENLPTVGIILFVVLLVSAILMLRKRGGGA